MWPKVLGTTDYAKSLAPAAGVIRLPSEIRAEVKHLGPAGGVPVSRRDVLAIRLPTALALSLLLAACSPTAAPSTTAAASTTAARTTTAAPSTTASPTGTPTDTTTWTTYTSARYGFSIGHPPDWTVVPADHDWTLADDADNWQSTGQEVFLPATRDIRVSAWSVAVPGTMEQTWEDVEAWVVEQYCPLTNDPSCAGVHDQAVRLCIERRDCHPALLVPFKDDVQAFLRGGIIANGEDMVVVAVWRGESDPTVALYGGSRRLLEAFLWTMGVCPVEYRNPEQTAWCLTQSL